eukprot:GEMP01001835.1.p1 GENE.GEMP01001835.1~~GEMP01001835.1.p1  ORF type:complete len:1360 (+),score=508.99 GEMP01001835.1:50-4129(+)
MRVVVLGCCHGELDKIYDAVLRMERHIGKVDLLLCSGDFQACRTEDDLKWLSVPEKHRRMGDFHQYFSGAKIAPILTIFVGGNHEAPSLLKDLYYGGWVAKNIYYLGHSGCVNVGGLRIAGVSGIFNARNYLRGHHEAPPYNNDTMRSAYHVREFEVKKLAQLTGKVDILLCHDWPRGVANYGDIEDLLRKKDNTGQLRSELDSGTFGSPANAELIEKLRPDYCFAAHMHVKFAALWPHDDDTVTRFLALDKCLPKRDYIQALEIQPTTSKNSLKKIPWRMNAYPPYSPGQREPTFLEVALDPEWCAILKAAYETVPLMKNPMSATVRAPTEEELEFVKQQLQEKGASLPFNFDKPDFEVPVLQKQWVSDLLDIGDIWTKEPTAPKVQAPCGFQTLTELRGRVDLQPTGATAAALEDIELATSNSDNEMQHNRSKRALPLASPNASLQKRLRVGSPAPDAMTLPTDNAANMPLHASEDIELGDLDDELPRRSPTSAIADVSSKPSPSGSEEIDLNESDDEEDACVRGPIPTVVVTPPQDDAEVAVEELDYDELELDADEEDEEDAEEKEPECIEAKTQEGGEARRKRVEREDEGNDEDVVTKKLKAEDSAEGLHKVSSPEAEPEPLDQASEHASLDGLSTRAVRFPSPEQLSVASFDEEVRDVTVVFPSVENEKAPSVSTDGDSFLAPLRMEDEDGDAKTATSSNIAVKCVSPEQLSVLSGLDAKLTPEGSSIGGDMAPVIHADDDVQALVAGNKEEGAIKDETNSINKTRGAHEESDIDVERDDNIAKEHVEAPETEKEASVDPVVPGGTARADVESETEQIDARKDAGASHKEGHNVPSEGAHEGEVVDGEGGVADEKANVVGDEEESEDEEDAPAKEECADIGDGAEKDLEAVIVENAGAAAAIADEIDRDMGDATSTKVKMPSCDDADTEARTDDAAKTEDEQALKRTTEGGMDVEESEGDAAKEEKEENKSPETADAEVDDEVKDKEGPAPDGTSPVDVDLEESNDGDSAEEENQEPEKPTDVEVVDDGVKDNTEDKTAKVNMDIEDSKDSDSAEEENMSLEKMADAEVVDDDVKVSEEKTPDEATKVDMDIDESNNGDSADDESKSHDKPTAVEVVDDGAKEREEKTPDQGAKVDMDVEESKDSGSAEEEKPVVENTTDGEVVDDDAKEKTPNRTTEVDEDVEESKDGDSAKEEETNIPDKTDGKVVDDDNAKAKIEEKTPNRTTEVDEDGEESKDADSAKVEEKDAPAKSTDVEVEDNEAKAKEGKTPEKDDSVREEVPERTTDATIDGEKAPDRTDASEQDADPGEGAAKEDTLAAAKAEEKEGDDIPRKDIASNEEESSEEEELDLEIDT